MRLGAVVLVAVLALLGAPLAGAGAPAQAGPEASAARTAPAAAAEVRTADARAAAKRSGKSVRKSTARKLTAKQRAARARAQARAQAQAAQSGAVPSWTGGTITYHDALPATWRWSLQAAVAQWNGSGVAVRFVPVADPARAQLRVLEGDTGANAGLATVGRTSGAFVKLSTSYRTRPGDAYDQVEVLGVLTHELGHVLGLEHTATGCDLMGTLMDIAGCGIYDWGRETEYRCDVLGAAAVSSAARRYGGTPGPRPEGSCTVGATA